MHVNVPLDLEIVKYFEQRAAEPGAEPFEVQLNRALQEVVERAKNEAPLSSPAKEADYTRLLENEKFIEAVAERVRQRV